MVFARLTFRHIPVIVPEFFRFKCAPLNPMSHYPRHRGHPPLLTGDPIPFRVHFPLSLEITCARVSFPKCTLCIRRFEMHGRRVRGNHAGVRDVTLAVVTISIPRLEPPRIADCGRVHDGSDVRIQTGMSAASGVSIMRTTAKRALAEVRRVRISERHCAPKPQYVPYSGTCVV